jgi:hypothetical protein
VRQDERFVNWMRTSALPRFRKLWGRVDALADGRAALEAGDVVVVSVVNRWNTYSFDGKKALVLVGGARAGARAFFWGGVCYGLGHPFARRAPAPGPRRAWAQYLVAGSRGRCSVGKRRLALSAFWDRLGGLLARGARRPPS